jgi:beta-galactosidase/beta-glucuronidase
MLLLFSVSAQQTETLYLSGTGLGDEKEWDFICSGGCNANKWSKIKVPSQWELQGYGEYTYGRWYKAGLKNPSMEHGMYAYTFSVPASWKNKQINIVFEGAMTDTEVKINGLLAGDIHQGGFYRFTYDISDKIKSGKKNKLEVDKLFEK